MRDTMESHSDKIFSKRAILGATFLGGPLVAGFLISKNFIVFGDEDAARKSLFLGIISTLLLFLIFLILPENIIDKIPQPVIPIIYTVIIGFLIDELQGDKIEEYMALKGQKASGWLAAGYGFIGMGIIAGFFFVMANTLPPAGYKESVDINANVKIYYQDMKKELIQEMAKVLEQSGFFDESQSADLFLSNNSDHYLLKFVLTDASFLSDTTFLTDFNALEDYLNYNLYFEKRIVIGFTDERLEKSFELKKVSNRNSIVYEPLLLLEQYKINANHTIFYNRKVPLEEVEKVKNGVIRLRGYFPFHQKIDIVFVSDKNGYAIKFFVAKELWQNYATINRLKSAVEYIKDCGIEEDIALVLIDNQTFEEIQI